MSKELSTEKIPNWITSGIDKDCIKFTDEFGKHLCDLDQRKRAGRCGLTTSQIRNFFGEVKRIQLLPEKQRVSPFVLLKPKMAYAAARVLQKNFNSRIKDFKAVVDKAYDAVEIKPNEDKEHIVDKDHFQNFVDLLESILAYHKVYGGRES